MNLTELDKRKLRDAFEVRSSISGNVMNFLGLEEIRQQFPGTWERHRERIAATALGIIRQFTDSSVDIILPVGEVNFVVLFTRLDKHNAMLRAAAIKAEILRRFLGDDVLGTLDMQVHAMELDSGSLIGGTLGTLLGGAFPANGNAAPEHEQTMAIVKEANSDQPAHHKIAQTHFLADDSDVEEISKRFEFKFDDLNVGFQPFLFTRRGVFSVFSCRPVRYSATGDILSGYGVLPRDSAPEQIATLDELVLMHARKGLVDMALRKRVAIVAVPVAFDTMTTRNAGVEYLSRLRCVPADLRNYVVPILHRCPAGVPEARLAEIIDPLKRLCRAVGVSLTSPRQSLAVLKAAGAYSIGFNLGTVAGTEMATPRFLERYGQVARKVGLATFVDGVDTSRQAAQCQDAKIDYLGGRMFAELSDYVGPVASRQSA